MKQKARAKPIAKPVRWYRGDQVPMAAIRTYARQVAEQFKPDKIILFGSQAYGTPNADSDVDLLVIMPTKNQLHQGIKIRRAIPVRFPMDLIVRTPANLKWRLDAGESFHTEILTRGKVLYEKDDSRMALQGRRRLARRRKSGGGRGPAA